MINRIDAEYIVCHLVSYGYVLCTGGNILHVLMPDKVERVLVMQGQRIQADFQTARKEMHCSHRTAAHINNCFAPEVTCGLGQDVQVFVVNSFAGFSALRGLFREDAMLCPEYEFL